jgi:hypothetical protein
MFYLKEFNFREKLEEENKSKKKCFGFLSSGAKQKIRGCKVQNYRGIYY